MRKHSEHKVDRQEQNVGARPRLGHAGRASKTTDPAATTEPEDRQPLHIGAEAETIHEAGLEARNREAGASWPPLLA
jgi:hypothetical protein